MIKIIEGNLFDTRAGGDWNVVSKMIEDTFQDFEVEIKSGIEKRSTLCINLM